MSEMRVKSEGPEELDLVAHNPAGGLFALVFAAGIYVLSRDGPGMPAALARGMAIFFAVVSLFAIIWRDRLHFDLTRSRWERTRGPWPFLSGLTRWSISRIRSGSSSQHRTCRSARRISGECVARDRIQPFPRST